VYSSQDIDQLINKEHGLVRRVRYVGNIFCTIKILKKLPKVTIYEGI
jgi:hypothetical protein